MSFTNICFKCKDPDNPCISFCNTGNYTCLCGHLQNFHKQLPNIDNQLLKTITDPWSDLSSTHSTHYTRRMLREAVMTFYNLKRNQCMILGLIDKKAQHVKTAHIYPKSRSYGLKYFGLSSSNIDNPRNCLRLVTAIKDAFDKKYVTIIEENSQLKMFLLNKTISSQRITSVSPHTFGNIHQAPLLFQNHNRPYRRMLALHCHSAFEKAKEKQKEFSLNDADFFNLTNFIQDLFRTSSDKDTHANVYQWLMDNPVGQEMPLETSSTTSLTVTKSLTSFTQVVDVCPLSSTTTVQDVPLPQSTPSSLANLIELFRMINEQPIDSNKHEEKLLQYIREKMNPFDQHYIQTIVLSYLQSCLIGSDTIDMAIDQDNARHRARMLKSILHDDNEKEIQVLCAIQKFIIQLKHPHGLACKLFHILYDEDCVSEEMFWNWLRRLNLEEKKDEIEIIESTRMFFNWLSESITSNIVEKVDKDDDSSYSGDDSSSSDDESNEDV